MSERKMYTTEFLLSLRDRPECQTEPTSSFLPVANIKFSDLAKARGTWGAQRGSTWESGSGRGRGRREEGSGRGAPPGFGSAAGGAGGSGRRDKSSPWDMPGDEPFVPSAEFQKQEEEVLAGAAKHAVRSEKDEKGGGSRFSRWIQLEEDEEDKAMSEEDRERKRILSSALEADEDTFGGAGEELVDMGGAMMFGRALPRDVEMMREQARRKREPAPEPEPEMLLGDEADANNDDTFGDSAMDAPLDLAQMTQQQLPPPQQQQPQQQPQQPRAGGDMSAFNALVKAMKISSQEPLPPMPAMSGGGLPPGAGLSPRNRSTTLPSTDAKDASTPSARPKVPPGFANVRKVQVPNSPQQPPQQPQQQQQQQPVQGQRFSAEQFFSLAAKSGIDQGAKLSLPSQQPQQQAPSPQQQMPPPQQQQQQQLPQHLAMLLEQHSQQVALQTQQIPPQQRPVFIAHQQQQFLYMLHQKRLLLEQEIQGVQMMLQQRQQQQQQQQQQPQQQQQQQQSRVLPPHMRQMPEGAFPSPDTSSNVMRPPPGIPVESLPRAQPDAAFGQQPPQQQSGRQFTPQQLQQIQQMQQMQQIQHMQRMQMQRMQQMQQQQQQQQPPQQQPPMGAGGGLEKWFGGGAMPQQQQQQPLPNMPSNVLSVDDIEHARRD